MSFHKKNPVVILGLGAGGLAAARSLGRRGVKLTGVYSTQGEPGRLSKYCRSLAFPEVSSEEPLFLEKLVKLGEGLEEKAVLISSSDKYISFVSRHSSLLSNLFLFHLPEKPSVEQLVSKVYMRELAVRAGLDIPTTFFPEDMEDLKMRADDLPCPCLVKPLDSFSIDFPGKNLFIKNSGDLLNLYETNNAWLGKTLIQEIIPGGDDCFFQLQGYFNGEGELIAAMTFRKKRQHPPGFGIGCYSRSEKNEEVTALALGLLRSIGYRGFAGIEFKRDPRTGRYYFIELNPRIPWCLSLATDCGVDLVLGAYLSLTGQISGPADSQQNDGVLWIDFKRDFKSFLRKRKKFEIGLTEWLVSLLKVTSFAYFDLKDPLPFVISTSYFIGGMLRALSRGLGHDQFLKELEASTDERPR